MPADAIGPPAMNFGQHGRWEGCRRCRYRYLIPADEFLRRASGPFDQARREIAADMADYPADWPEPAFVRFRELGFPPLSVLLGEHPHVLSGLIVWLALDLLNWLEESDGGSGTRYSANSLDLFAVSEGCVEVGGVAYEVVAGRDSRAENRTPEP